RVSRRSEHNRLEAGYALGLLATVGLLLLLSFHAEARVDTASARERPRLTVDVTGSRWVWTFHYRDQRITEQSGFVGHGALTVPTNQPVRFNLRSSDVIHSFWIPQLDYKRDLIPGTTERVTLDFDRAGWFGGGCAEFCGLHHAEMVFQVHAVTPAQFRAWAASHGGSR
ncbi:MAG: cytochrome c oxidase subunit II, partial [Solirubrobacterales bacterium]|nr:cytochrome c oxidase subunit II [Solirubrobacterales bacterium]